MPSKLDSTAARILRATTLRPALGIVLGSGFGPAEHAVEVFAEIPYSELPGFPRTKVEGHGGKLVLGRLAKVPVVLLCGRSHYYEGHSMAAITFPVRTLAATGVRVLLLTNAAGAINRRFRPGDFMCLEDHLNLMGDNPLRGLAAGGTASFLDLSRTYDSALNGLLAQVARQQRVRLHRGIYAAVPGPCYETPAEIRAFARLGADAVGMSTVPEAIVARHCGMRVAALSCLTNYAAGLNVKPITHAEVLATGQRVQLQASVLLTGFAGLLRKTALDGTPG